MKSKTNSFSHLSMAGQNLTDQYKMKLHERNEKVLSQQGESRWLVCQGKISEKQKPEVSKKEDMQAGQRKDMLKILDQKRVSQVPQMQLHMNNKFIHRNQVCKSSITSLKNIPATKNLEQNDSDLRTLSEDKSYQSTKALRETPASKAKLFQIK